MKVAVVGDVHGALDPLRTLADQIAAVGVDEIVLLGDLVDRGPNSAGVVRFVVDEWAFKDRAGTEKRPLLVRGNHDDNYIRAWRGLDRPDRPCRPVLNDPWLPSTLGDDVMTRWEERSSLFVRFPRFFGEQDLVCVHGGIAPADTSLGRITQLRTRFLYPGRRFWAQDYDGRFGFVVAGHETVPAPREFDHALVVNGEGYGFLDAVVVSNEDEQRFLHLRTRRFAPRRRRARHV